MPGLQATRRARPVVEEPGAAQVAPSPQRPSPLQVYVPLVSAAAVVVAADQLTKNLALDELSGGRSIDLVEGVLRLRLTFNSGGAFGLLQGLPALFLISTLAIVAGILIGAHRLEHRSWAVPLGMVLGGGLGNAADRLLRDTGGAVVDFIDLRFWPVFNVADMSIVIGALLILVLGWRKAPAEAGP